MVVLRQYGGQSDVGCAEAFPEVGDKYRQEYYQGEAEDMAEVVRVGAAEEVAGLFFENLTVIEEWTPLSPEIVEEKYYTAAVGLVLETTVAGGSGRIELISFTPGA